MSDESTPTSHPDDLEIELSRMGEADAAVDAHVATCASCTARRSTLAALAASFREPTPLVPREREEALIARMRERAGELRWRRRAQRAAWIGAAAAAAILLSLLLVRVERLAPTSVVAAHDAAAPTRDVNGDGQVDILDALALERALKAGRAGGFDVNADGVVNHADVDALARAVVSMQGRT